MDYKENSEVLGSSLKVTKYMNIKRRKGWGFVADTVFGIYLPFPSIATELLTLGGSHSNTE